MPRIRLSSTLGNPALLALPVAAAGQYVADPAGDQTGAPDATSDAADCPADAADRPVDMAVDDAAEPVVLLPTAPALPAELTGPATVFLAEVEHTGAAGTVQALPRPGQVPSRLLLAGVGAGDEAGWRAAGAALSRAAQKQERLSVALPDKLDPVAVRGLVEGLLLASYRFRLGAVDPDSVPKLRQVNVLVANPDWYANEVAIALLTAEYTCLARDLTNWPSQEKSPAWFTTRVTRAAAKRPGVAVTVRESGVLKEEGFGGLVAVGSASARGPRLVQLDYRPRRAKRHIVLVGKGITFDTGGINIKPSDSMRLMRKDMAGAAAVMAAALGAAALELPIQVTALAPLAENMVSGSAFRPGDVIRHYGGQTSEILNTDAEGRLVLADALAYATRRLKPDLIVDLATLTGANAVALGKRTAALYSDSDELAEQLTEAATAAGEKVWRMPLPDDYVEALGSEVADLTNATQIGAGSITAALFLREFVGDARDRWAHLDMSAPAWADSADAELVKGATGWGVRTLLRWLASRCAQGE